MYSLRELRDVLVYQLISAFHLRFSCIGEHLALIIRNAWELLWTPEHLLERRTPLSSRVATGISWSQLSGLKGVKPPVELERGLGIALQAMQEKKAIISR